MIYRLRISSVELRVGAGRHPSRLQVQARGRHHDRTKGSVGSPPVGWVSRGMWFSADEELMSEATSG